ncbi:UNVERIFIED_CONTAM: hypothetical protein FKN15_047436 [Acipenser sinensis]
MDRNALAELLQALESRRDAEERRREERYTALIERSLFQHVQLDSMERDWFRFAALGNAAALGQLLKQDPTLASKKVITANQK